MANIEPYQYQKVTNIKEHNDIVAKINEIVDVINNTNLDTVIPRISKLETDVNELTDNDSVQNTDISSLKTKTVKLETNVSELTDNDSVQNTDISSLKTKTAKLETDVSELTDNDSVQNTDISSLKTKTAKLETDVSAINDTDSLQWQDIESVKGDIGTITPKIGKVEQDILDINSTDAVQNTDITNLKAKDSEHDRRLETVDTEINGITKSLVSDVAILNGTTSGNVKVRIERKDAPSIDSNDYNIQKPTSIELVQGSAPAMVKAQITLSDGTVLISDDFMFTTEAIGQDVYISSFVFKNGNVAGSISADIGLSNGSTLEANNFVVPTDPNVTTAISDIQGRVTTVENDVSGLKTTVSGHTTSINKLNSEVSNLQTRVTTVEGSVRGLDELKATVEGHTTSINKLDNDVADLQIDKADANNGNQSIVAGSINATNITKGGVDVATVNDIPSVPDISGKADLNNSSQIIVAGTINATNINKNGVSVATVNDIPSVPDISGKADKNNSSQIIVAGTVKATNITKGNVNVATVNDIPDISGKVNIAQGTDNAGKALVVGADGNVTPTVISNGKTWEVIDMSNPPKDWVIGDIVKIALSATQLSSGIGSINGSRPTVEFWINPSQSSSIRVPYAYYESDNSYKLAQCMNGWNSTGIAILRLKTTNSSTYSDYDWSTIKNVAVGMWRLKK